MADTYLTSVGLTPSWQNLRNLLFTEKAQWKQVDTSGIRYSAAVPDASGFTITAVATDDWTDTNIVLAPRHPLECAVWQVRPGLAEVTVLDPERPEGSLEERTWTKLLVTVDEPHCFPAYPLTAVGNPVLVRDFSIGAIAVEFTVWDSVEQWEQTQEPIRVGAEVAAELGSDTVTFAPEFITSPWLWAIYGRQASADEANAATQVRAVCNEVTLVHNEVGLYDRSCW